MTKEEDIITYWTRNGRKRENACGKTLRFGGGNLQVITKEIQQQDMIDEKRKDKDAE
jgi:hypothetical protein